MPSNFTLPKPIAGTELTITDFTTSQTQIETAIRDLQDATPNNGSVTTVATVDTDVAQIFDATVTNASTTPTITFTRIAKAANLVYASPTTGADAVPTFRSLVAADLPTVPYTKGGNGLTSIGTAYQMTRVNSAGNAIEWFSMVAASGDKITLTPSSGTPNKLTIDVDPTKIEIDALAATIKLSIAKGGTGQSTAQAAIDALTAISGATNEYVLTKDTATGNALWKAPSVGITDVNGLTGSTITIETDDIAEGGGAVNLWFTDARVAANSAVTANTAKVTNATHTGDVTGSTALTIAANAVTYAKFQAISATKKLIGRITAGAGTAEEIAISGNLAMSASDLIVRTSKIKTVTANYSVPLTEGTILVNGTSLTITLPDTATVADGDEFIIKNIAGAATNTVTVFNIGTETIDGNTTHAMNLAYDVVTLKYGGSSKWYIISKIVNV